MAYIERAGRVTIKEVAHVFGLERRVASRLLRSMKGSVGLIEKKGRGRTKLYGSPKSPPRAKDDVKDLELQPGLLAVFELVRRNPGLDGGEIQRRLLPVSVRTTRNRLARLRKLKLVEYAREYSPHGERRVYQVPESVHVDLANVLIPASSEAHDQAVKQLIGTLARPHSDIEEWISTSAAVVQTLDLRSSDQRLVRVVSGAGKFEEAMQLFLKTSNMGVMHRLQTAGKLLRTTGDVLVDSANAIESAQASHPNQ